MIRSLTGTITAQHDLYVTIDVRGVGYLVGCPTAATIAVGETYTLHTHLAVRETALDLYGFQSFEELELFELLLSVPKIGPKSALQVLAQATPPVLLDALTKKDATYLHKLSGIGKKTCENIVTALHEKVSGLVLATTGTEGFQLDSVQTDAIDALVALGYDLPTARETIKNLTGTNVQELISQALKQL